MTKTTSKSTALSIITRKLEAEKKLHKPDSFYEKSPEHQRSPSSSSEEEEAPKKQHQINDADEVLRELDMEGEENEEEEFTEKDSQLSDDEKATISDSTTKVSEEAEPITLDEVLTQAGVSIQERKTIKEGLSFWWPGDLVDLSQSTSSLSRSIAPEPRDKPCTPLHRN